MWVGLSSPLMVKRGVNIGCWVSLGMSLFLRTSAGLFAVARTLFAAARLLFAAITRIFGHSVIVPGNTG